MTSSFVSATVAVVLGWCASASAQVYRFTDLGVFPGGTYCLPRAINDHGDVVGAADRPGLGQRAFLWHDGVLLDIGTPGGATAVAGGINNAGLVVGWGPTASGATHHLFIYDISTHSITDAGALGVRITAAAINEAGELAGTYKRKSYGGATNAFYAAAGQPPQDIGMLEGGINAAANGINNAGVVAGWSAGGTFGVMAFTYRSGAFTPLGVPPGYTVTQGMAINQARQVAVTATRGDGTYRAFLFDGQWHDCGSLGGAQATSASNAKTISEDGQILGSASLTDGDHAFIWSASSGMIDLNTYAPDGWKLLEADAVNAAGLITGVALVGGQHRGFLLTPCVADMNHDGLVDFADYLEFLNLFDAQDPSVDFNHDGIVEFADYLEFLNLFDAGC